MSPAESWYSVRMRAAAGGPHEAGGRHLSGAERLVPLDAVSAVTRELYERAAARGAAPDFIRLCVERIPATAIKRIPCLPVTTVTAATPDAARAEAGRLLERAGVAPAAVERAFAALHAGLGSPGPPLRGAALWDARTGERREPDPCRGVRASRFDYAPEGRAAIEQALAAHGLTHFRVREALAVASKVLRAGVAAELCWSDDPEYCAGYVATPAAGYVRFPAFKPYGAAGGRVFFAAPGADVACVVERLERACVLIEPPVEIRTVAWLSEAG